MLESHYAPEGRHKQLSITVSNNSHIYQLLEGQSTHTLWEICTRINTLEVGIEMGVYGRRCLNARLRKADRGIRVKHTEVRKEKKKKRKKEKEKEKKKAKSKTQGNCALKRDQAMR